MDHADIVIWAVAKCIYVHVAHKKTDDNWIYIWNNSKNFAKKALTFVETGGKICLVLETESNLVNAKHELSARSFANLSETMSSLVERTSGTNEPNRERPLRQHVKFEKLFQKVVDKRKKLWYSYLAVARTTTKNLENWTVCKTLKILIKMALGWAMNENIQNKT